MKRSIIAVLSFLFSFFLAGPLPHSFPLFSARVLFLLLSFANFLSQPHPAPPFGLSFTIFFSFPLPSLLSPFPPIPSPLSLPLHLELLEEPCVLPHRLFLLPSAPLPPETLQLGEVGGGEERVLREALSKGTVEMRPGRGGERKREKERERKKK
jgi:hypothetical protein